jgi:serine/threonine protein phosphatase PrpC
MDYGIRIVSTSLTGRKHRDKGKPCEDASLSVYQDGVYVVCLSDGAGGSQYTHAELGSKCVVQTVCDLMVRHFDAFFFELHESTVRSVLVAAVQAELAILSQELSIEGMDRLSATMIFCAVKDTRMICGHIGDGVIAKVTGSGLQPITLPQNGEDASSTIFMTLPDAQDYLRIIRTTTDDTHAVVLMTDGISDMVFDGTKLLLMPVVARLAELGAFAKDESEKQLIQTIRSFIIDASPLSDDASIGIVYISDTNPPDISNIPSIKENCIRNTGDEMRIVQKEILPRVRMAKSIISSEYVKVNHIDESAAEVISGKIKTEGNEEISEIQSTPVVSDISGDELSAAAAEMEDNAGKIADQTTEHTRFSHKFSGLKRYLFDAGLLLVAFVLVLILYYYIH